MCYPVAAQRPRKFLIVVVVLPGHVAVHLSEDLEGGDAVDEYQTIDGVIDLVVLDSVEYDRVVVIRKFVHQSSCRRYDDLVAVLLGGDVEDAVLIEVLSVDVREALDKSEGGSDLISREGSVGVQRERRILPCEQGVVPGDLPVLLDLFLIVLLLFLMCDS